MLVLRLRNRPDVLLYHNFNNIQMMKKQTNQMVQVSRLTRGAPFSSFAMNWEFHSTRRFALNRKLWVNARLELSGIEIHATKHASNIRN